MADPAVRERTGHRVAILVPPVVCHGLDPHTGIPFMPHMAAYLAGALRHSGHEVRILDAFGIDCRRTEVVQGEFLLMGERIDDLAERVPSETEVCFLYCRTIAEFIALERLIDRLRLRHPAAAIALFENIQAVTSFSILDAAEPMLRRGAACLVGGEPEDRADEVTRRLVGGRPLAGIPGIAYAGPDGAVIRTEPAKLPQNLDALPRPAWELFDLEGYWQAGFAHAPVRRGERFLPLLTSRGCPFRCAFCISPGLNPVWRAHSAARVADDMEHFQRTLGVTDFHVSDLNPTVSDRRVRELCDEILRRKLAVTWKLAQGTKIETIKSTETLDLMARAGCVYLSFSPESGSRRILERVGKPFDYDHALFMAHHMGRLGIRMQAVFLGGLPEEDKEDRELSRRYASVLVRAGVDEISLVIFSPVPGAALAGSIEGFTHYSQCTPSPNWRPDYAVLTAYRRRMYLNLFWQTLRHHPSKLLREIRGVLTARYETKMEMSLVKQLRLYLLRYAPWIYATNRRESTR